MGLIIKQAAENTKDQNGIASVPSLLSFVTQLKIILLWLVAFHGAGEGEKVLNVGVSGPGVVLNALKKYPWKTLVKSLSDKKTSFKITSAENRLDEWKHREFRYSILGLSTFHLAPTNAFND